MTKKIAISLPDETLKRAKTMVRSGKAKSVSGYIAALIDDDLAKESVDELFDEIRRRQGYRVEEWNEALQAAEADLTAAGVIPPIKKHAKKAA